MCVINHTYRFVFVHIPKTAGTSVATFLSTLSTYRDLEVGATALGVAIAPHFGKRYGLRKHSTIGEIARVMGDEQLSTYTSFAVVRDPFRRVVSLFRFLHQWTAWRDLPGFGAFVRDFDRQRDINEFIASPLFATPGPDRSFEPQVTWLTDRDGWSLKVDRVVRLESLEDDLRGLLRDIGVPDGRLVGTIPRANTSASGDWREALDARSTSIVRSRYARDLLMLGYGP